MFVRMFAQSEAKKMVALRKGANPEGLDGERSSHFHQTDLRELKIPQRAWPLMDKQYKGQKGYTVNSVSGAVLGLY